MLQPGRVRGKAAGVRPGDGVELVHDDTATDGPKPAKFVERVHRARAEHHIRSVSVWMLLPSADSLDGRELVQDRLDRPRHLVGVVDVHALEFGRLGEGDDRLQNGRLELRPVVTNRCCIDTDGRPPQRDSCTIDRQGERRVLVVLRATGPMWVPRVADVDQCLVAILLSTCRVTERRCTSMVREDVVCTDVLEAQHDCTLGEVQFLGVPRPERLVEAADDVECRRA